MGPMLRTALALLWLWPAAALALPAINLPPPATDSARDIYGLHMLTLYIATGLLVVVVLIVGYAIITFRKARGAVPDQEFHRTRFGTWSWIVVPLLVLGVDLTIAGNAHGVLEKLWTAPRGELLELKVTGHQWWWEYEYLDSGVRLESRFTPADQAGDLYLREADHHLMLPVGRPVRFLHTSADVLHSFWVAELGFRKDAIPGYVTETWTTPEKEGIFRGQCAQLCGTWHSRMPIVVEVVSGERFDAWLAQQKAARKAALAAMDPNRKWTRTELMARGRQEYAVRCAACHQLNGEGLPPSFPALKGSRIAAGPAIDHIKRVLNGVPGTAMGAWAQLTDMEIAAIVTYERNAFNGLDETVQPLQVNAARGAAVAGK